MCSVEKKKACTVSEKNKYTFKCKCMIVRHRMANITPTTFSGFPAVPSDSLFSGNDFSPVIMGLARKQRLRDPLKQLSGYASSILVRKASAHTPDPTVLHQLCDLWHCNTEHNTHTHAHARQSLRARRAKLEHWRLNRHKHMRTVARRCIIETQHKARVGCCFT